MGFDTPSYEKTDINNKTENTVNNFEKQKNDIDNIVSVEKKDNKLEIANIDIINKYENKDIFIDFLNSLDQETQNKVLNILKNIPKDDFDEYLEDDLEGSNIVDEESLEDFFDNFEEYNIEIKAENIKINHKDILKSYENYEKFIKFIENLKLENRNKLINILKNISKDDLEEYLEDDLDGTNIINEENLEDFFDNFEDLDKKEEINENQKELEELFLAIDNFTESDKKNKKLINYYINKINKLKNNNKLLEKITEYDLKLKGYNKKTEEENKKTEEENKKTEEEKEYIETKIEATEGHKYLKSKIGDLKDIFRDDEEFSKLLEEIDSFYNSGDLDQHRESISTLLNDYFQKNGNAKKFFEKLSAKPELYESIYNSLLSISPILKSSLVKPKGEEKGINPIPYILPDTKTVYKNGDIITAGDKQIDFSKKPPKAYITLENGFKIETKFSIPNTMAIRAEYQKAKLEYEPKIEKLDKDINKLQNSIQTRTEENKKLDELIKELENQPETTENKLKITEAKKKKEKNEIIINQERQRLSLAVDTKQDFEERLQKATGIFNSNMREALIKAKDKIKERDEEVRNNLKFLESTGYSLLPQSVTSPLLGFIRRHKGIINENLGGYEVKGGIDFTKGEFGGSKNESADYHKKIFMSLFNKMLTGNPNEPIDPKHFDQIIRGENGTYKNTTHMMGILKKHSIVDNKGIWSLSKMQDNLINNGKDEEEKKN